MHTFEKRVKPLTIPWARSDLQGYESELIFMSTHTGTHMDAPYHFDPSGKKIDELPVDRFVRDAVLLRISKAARTYVTRDDIERAEKKNRIGRGDAVVIATGWERHRTRRDYLTSNPGLSEDAARYLISRGASMVGVDTANVDHPVDNGFVVHRTLLPRGVLIVENLCNLAKIRARRFRLIVLPLKIMGASGSPVRALAMLGR